MTTFPLLLLLLPLFADTNLPTAFRYPQVINAALTLAARPTSKVAQDNMEVFKQSWLNQVSGKSRPFQLSVCLLLLHATVLSLQVDSDIANGQMPIKRRIVLCSVTKPNSHGWKNLEKNTKT